MPTQTRSTESQAKRCPPCRSSLRCCPHFLIRLANFTLKRPPRTFGCSPGLRPPSVKWRVKFHTQFVCVCVCVRASVCVRSGLIFFFFLFIFSRSGRHLVFGLVLLFNMLSQLNNLKFMYIYYTFRFARTFCKEF